MTAFTEKLDRAAGAALCEAVRVGGQSLIGYGAVGLAAGGTGIVPLTAGMVALMAYSAGCAEWDPDQPGPDGPQPPGICYEGGSLFQIRQLTNGEFQGGATPNLREITSTVFREKTDCQTGGNREIWDINWINEFGVPGSTGLFLGGPCGGSVYDWEQVWAGDDTCEKPGPEPTPPEFPPYEYTDPEDGCKLTVNLKGFQVDPTGEAAPVFKIEPAPETRADGGVIGGCNFSPVIYAGPTGCQCPEPRPWNPDWDTPVPPGGTPPWQDFLNDLAGGVISNIITNAITDLYAEPLPPAEYTLLAPCEQDDEGNPLEIKVQIPSLPANDALATRIEALIPILQGQKNFKQPICPPQNDPLEGEFRTIGFISEQTSPNGKSPLRKRLRYRSVSGLGLDAVIEHWKDFRFDAGPVTVKHRGARWGTITVWAATADEGKRVIRHAAGEADIDADKTGRWEISGSSSSRLGMPGTMKVNQTGGYYWITARDGSNNRPLVGKT